MEDHQEVAWSLEALSEVLRPSPEQKAWIARQLMAEAEQTKCKLKHLAVGYGFQYATVRVWVDKVKKNAKFNQGGEHRFP